MWRRRRSGQRVAVSESLRRNLSSVQLFRASSLLNPAPPSVLLSPGVSTWAVTSRQRFLHALQVERAQVCGRLRRNLLGNSCSGNRGTSWRRAPTQRTSVNVDSDVRQALTTQQEMLTLY